MFLLALAGIPLPAAGQVRTVSGTVTDQSREPLPGVNILCEGTTVGTITDISGVYSLSLPANAATLKFSLVGFEAVSVPVGSRTAIDVVMKEETQLIDEVVVVGYGTQKKATLTGAVSSVGSDELTVTPSSNVQNMIAGKLPGVRIQQRTGEPGSYDAKMDIRGLGTPLIVIDGVVRDVADFQRLEANEIESISVLKDASAAIYGMRASSGLPEPVRAARRAGCRAVCRVGA